MKNLFPVFFFVCILFASTLNAAEENTRVVVIPLPSSATIPSTESQTLVSASGEWTSAGLALPSMIVKELFFYVESDTDPPCDFSMNYVINQAESRTIQRFSLARYETVQLHFASGVNASDLRFGTISSSGSEICVRNWAAFGIELQEE